MKRHRNYIPTLEKRRRRALILGDQKTAAQTQQLIDIIRLTCFLK